MLKVLWKHSRAGKCPGIQFETELIEEWPTTDLNIECVPKIGRFIRTLGFIHSLVDRFPIYSILPIRLFKRRQ